MKKIILAIRGYFLYTKDIENGRTGMSEPLRIPRSEGFQTPKVIQFFRLSELYRYTQFLEEFHGYLSTPTQEEYGQYEGEYRLPRFTQVRDKGWLKKLEGYGKRVGFPTRLEGELSSALVVGDILLLSWVIERALKKVKEEYSALKKFKFEKTDIVVWFIFQLRKIVRRLSSGL